MKKTKLNFEEFKKQYDEDLLEISIVRPVIIGNQKVYYEKCKGIGIIYKYVVIDKIRKVKAIKIMDKEYRAVPLYLLNEYFKYRLDLANELLEKIDKDGIVSDTTDLDYTEKETYIIK